MTSNSKPPARKAAKKTSAKKASTTKKTPATRTPVMLTQKETVAATSLPESTPASATLRPTSVVVRTTNLDREVFYSLAFSYDRDVAVQVTQLKSKQPYRCVLKARTTAPPSSALLLTHWGSVFVDGPLVELQVSSRPPTRRVDGALLPAVPTPLLEQKKLKLTVGRKRYTLLRDTEPFAVRVTVNGKRMKISCANFCHDNEDGFGTMVSLALDGPLRGAPLLVREEEMAMRVTVVDGQMVAPQRWTPTGRAAIE